MNVSLPANATRALIVDTLAPIVTAAVDCLVAAGFASELFVNVKVAIADLPGTTLGLATGNTITIDVNAAGYGWAVSRGTRVESQEPEDSDAYALSQRSTLNLVSIS